MNTCGCLRSKNIEKASLSCLASRCPHIVVAMSKSSEKKFRRGRPLPYEDQIWITPKPKLKSAGSARCINQAVRRIIDYKVSKV